MPSITQTIPQYSLGMSEQPDQLKFPGQVQEVTNAIPDITKGLFKRPGAKRIGTTPLANVQSGGSWFHYFRDETEGSYIGQIAADGQIRVWRCSDGVAMTTVYGTGGQTAITNYLATSTPENIQTLTINDTTFLTNRDTTNANTLIKNTHSGTYSQSGTTVTITCNQHNLSVGNSVNMDYTSGNAVNGDFLVQTVADSNTFTLTAAASASTSGNVTIKPLTDSYVDKHFAYVELLRTENGRQYGLNINNGYTVTTVKRATKIKITDHSFSEADGTGTCPGIGTEVYAATAASSYSSLSNVVHVKNSSGTPITTGKDNLTFRVTALGQQGISPNYNANNSSDISPGGSAYRCSYNIECTLLHGGEGWDVGDVVRVHPEHADEAAASDSQAYVEITVTEIESTQINATVSSNGDGMIRPSPTPFDADTAVTADTILGGIIDQLPSGITGKVIGPGIYFSSSTSFSIEICEEDLMRCIQKSTNDVQNLPSQCKHGYIVKIANARVAEEDDYYLQFIGENNRDGTGSWTECAKPGIAKTLVNMPLVIQRTSSTQFTVKQFTYSDRSVGDDTTNPMPSFVGGRINKVLFFRNRLAVLSGENVITSRPGTFGVPNFFAESALTVGAADPIDISASSIFPSELFDGIEINTGLVVFSTNQQFLLASDDTVLNPDTAKLRSVATYNYNETIPPISLGTTLAYLDNSGKYSRFNEMANTQREGEPSIVEVSKVVPTLLPKDIDLLTNSRDNSMVLMGKTDSDMVYGYRYFQVSDERKQAAWFTWKLNNPLLYHFIINDEYYFLDTDKFLQCIKIIQASSDPTITQDDTEFLLHIDNHTTISGGSFNASTNLTTFSSVSWLPSVTTPNYDLVLIDTDTNAARIGRYAKPTYSVVSSTNNTASGTSFTVPGDWSREVTTITVTNGGSGYTTAPTVTISGGSGSGAEATATIKNGAVTSVDIVNNGYNYTSVPTVAFTGGGGSSAAATAAIHTGIFTIGYIYPYEVKIPTLYPTKMENNRPSADVNSSLILHRVKFHFGKIGLYETTLERVGKTDYTEVYESTNLDEYKVSDAPYLEEYIKTIPVYEKNTNVEITLKSSHPAPATLRSMSWEGDYSPKYYRRV